jgi:DNA-directed RNA polymerase subunit RPC12/RpoP
VTADLKFNCPRCQQHLRAPADMQGAAIECPACRHPIHIPQLAPAPAFPMASAPPAPATPADSPRCAYCQSTFGSDEEQTACPECQAAYHSECWQENKGCAVYGCSQGPEAEQRDALEIPISYWGQEHKNCPVCRTQILAAAVRCRVCGTTFSSARPEDGDQFALRQARLAQAPGLRKKVVWLFVFCALPCTALIATIAGGVWYLARRREIGALPALYPALCKIGLAVGLGQTIIVALALLAAATRGG